MRIIIQMSILDLKDSNKLLSKYIKEGKAFNALRFGLEMKPTL